MKYYLYTFFLCFLYLTQWQCSQKRDDQVPSKQQNQKTVEREGWNSTLYVTKMAVPQAKVQYGHMKQYEKDPLVYLDESVIVDFFDENGKIESHLTSNKGIYNEKAKDVSAMENVVVVSDTGVTLLTEYLEWDNKKGKIVSDTTVTFIQEGDTLYGKGFVSDSDLQNWEIRKPWGVREKGVDMHNVHSEFEKPVRTDTMVHVSDSVQIDPINKPDSLESD